VIEELRIRGLGVIDDAVLPLDKGLTVVTGETGAGKTMVVTGLLLLFGGRADAARVRSGADQASVDGRLEIDAASAVAERVRDAGGELDDGTGLLLRRTVSSAGRSRAYVGGTGTPIAVLGELADQLIAVHGQSDQLRLTRGEQRSALDRFAGIDLAPYRTAFREWREASAAYDDRVSRTAELRREADLLTHGLAEIEAAAPQPGEDLELTTLATTLASADALRLAAGAAHNAMMGSADDPVGDAANVLSLLGEARRALAQQEGADPNLDELAQRLTELVSLAVDLGTEFGSYVDRLDADPARLEQIEQRRAVLNTLIRKYADGPQPDLAAVLEWAKAAAQRLDEIDVSDEAIAALAAARDAAAETAATEAVAVSRRRREAAVELGAAVTAELAGLAMPTARLLIEVRHRAATAGSPALTLGDEQVGAGTDGVDEVEFLLQPHPDAPALPVAKGASGGELSRVMLGLEVCLAATDPVPTMVFDEVDAGIGGRAATEVGRRLARLARSRQVVVVTHLAQVAAFADRHVLVDKQTATGGADDSSAVTASDVRVLTGDDRLAELARMLGGSASDTALEHAAELLRAATADVAPESAAEPAGPAAEAAAETTKAGRRPRKKTPARG